MSDDGRATRISKSERAGLTFSVARVERNLRRTYHNKHRIGVKGAVFLAAVLEYLIAELCELAGNVVHSDRKRRVRIKAKDISMAIKHDEEYNKLVGKVTIPEGGVVSFIHPALLPKKRDDGPGTPNNPIDLDDEPNDSGFRRTSMGGKTVKGGGKAKKAEKTLPVGNQRVYGK